MSSSGGRVIALLGAESTGKTALAQALCERLMKHGAGRCTWVPEGLRLWCEAAGRTPQAQEQAAIAREQSARIEQARLAHDWVVADTTAVMTAVYSRLLFQDESLMHEALSTQRRYALTLVTDNDVPWQADGLQRDGPHVREPVRASVQQALDGAGIAWSRVQGLGQARVDAAWAACRGLPYWMERELGG